MDLIALTGFLLLVAEGSEDVASLDWQLWERYRGAVVHPASVLKAEHLQRAQENIARYAWAREEMQRLEASAQDIAQWDEAFIVRMIPDTTPGSTLFTLCPHCEKFPVHGSWRWRPERPEEIQCNGCGLVFPNEEYPEDLLLRSRFDPKQVFAYHGGKSWNFYGFHLRSSFSGYIRAAKVNYMASSAYRAALAYAVTQKPDYAKAVRRILLRFAEVYPRYLVHSGYGEYADLPPHEAIAAMKDLPADELTPPPNRPDRRLHPPGNPFWMAGRATESGQEGHFLRQCAIAYDLTCTARDEAGRPLWSEEERRRVERDLLLEGALLALADPAINNKSVANRSAAGIIGMVVGQPQLVRFGAEGFWRTVYEWFLPDGSTSESPGYGLMTLNGIYEFGEALHGYSDPSDEKRWEKVDVYGDPRYRQVWRVMVESLLPSLRYPAIADSYHATTLPARFLELLVLRYNEPQHRALLKAMAGEALSGTDRGFALFHRPPDLPQREFPPLAFRSQLFPEWRIAFLRTGERGMDATVILSASHWGGHHHLDSLNLTYHRWGEELLGDLGYLWDNPMASMTRRTAAHNLVVVDEQEQRTTERGGEFRFFHGGSHVQAAEAQSQAYAQCDLYRRTVLVVSHDHRRHYVVDIFRVRGGTVHDYLFHGPHHSFSLEGLSLSPAPSEAKAPYGLQNLRTAKPSGAWRALWTMGEGRTFVAWMLPQADETVLWGDGWGQKGGARVHPDPSITLPYVLRRRPAQDRLSVFVSVFVAEEGEPFVRSAAPLTMEEEGAAALRIETAQGVDYLFSRMEERRRSLLVEGRPLELEKPLTVLHIRHGEVIWREEAP